MPPVWFSFIAPELLCKSYMITTLCTALYHSSGFFIIMSPAEEGLHFSALVILKCSWMRTLTRTIIVILNRIDTRDCHYKKLGMLYVRVML